MRWFVGTWLLPVVPFHIINVLGIWDCFSSQAAVNFVRRQVAQGKQLSSICEIICDHCLAPNTVDGAGAPGCDNMTIMIIAILHGRTKEDWYKWVKERVNPPSDGKDKNGDEGQEN